MINSGKAYMIKPPVLRSSMTATPKPLEENTQVQKTQEMIIKPKNDFDKDLFLQELQDFMDVSAIEEFNLNSIDDPATMTSSQANYFIKLYNSLLEEKNKINELCDNELNRVQQTINEFREKSLKNLDNQAKYFESILKKFLLSEIDGKKTKSVKLPYGTLSVKAMQPKYIYENETETLAYIKSIKPEFVNTQIIENINKAALKKECQIKNGKLYLGDVLIPNVEVQQQEQKFEIKGPK